MKTRIFTLAAAIALLFATTRFVGAQGTAFTYQGQLGVNGAAANGNFDLRFGLYTNISTGNAIGSLITNSATAVTSGMFTTTLNFGNIFNGANYWVEIGVRTNGSTGAFTTLTPRQPITPAPYAISASNLLGTLPATQLSGPLPASVFTGTFSNTVSLTNSGNILAGNGSGLTGLITPTQGNYLFALDTNVQVIATSAVFQPITFSSSGANNGWTVGANGVFTANQSGIYLIQYHVNLEDSTTSTVITAAVRAMVNGTTEISGSESIVGIEPAYTYCSASQSFLFQFAAGQTLTLQIIANGANTVAIASGTTFGVNLFPGATLTIIRIQ